MNFADNWQGQRAGRVYEMAKRKRADGETDDWRTIKHQKDTVRKAARATKQKQKRRAHTKKIEKSSEVGMYAQLSGPYARHRPERACA